MTREEEVQERTERMVEAIRQFGRAGEALTEAVGRAVVAVRQFGLVVDFKQRQWYRRLLRSRRPLPKKRHGARRGAIR